MLACKLSEFVKMHLQEANEQGLQKTVSNSYKSNKMYANHTYFTILDSIISPVYTVITADPICRREHHSQSSIIKLIKQSNCQLTQNYPLQCPKVTYIQSWNDSSAFNNISFPERKKHALHISPISSFWRVLDVSEWPDSWKLLVGIWGFKNSIVSSRPMCIYVAKK